MVSKPDGRGVPSSTLTRIDLQEPDTGIEPESSCSQSRFRFEQSMHIVQHRVGGVYS